MFGETVSQSGSLTPCLAHDHGLIHIDENAVAYMDSTHPDQPNILYS